MSGKKAKLLRKLIKFHPNTTTRLYIGYKTPKGAVIILNHPQSPRSMYQTMKRAIKAAGL